MQFVHMPVNNLWVIFLFDFFRLFFLPPIISVITVNCLGWRRFKLGPKRITVLNLSVNYCLYFESRPTKGPRKNSEKAFFRFKVARAIL